MGRFQSLIRRTLLTRWLLVRAQIFMSVRRWDQAHASLQRVVTIDPACYAAHFFLGEIAWRRNQRREALQEFSICYRLSPDRFGRQALPAELQDEVATRSLEFPDAPVFDVPRGGECGPVPGEWDDLLSGLEEDPRDPAPPGSDFVDGAEYRRLSQLSPIQAGDLKRVDWDGLLARLVEDPHPGGARDQG
jgi:hypothetical protein